VAGCFWTHASWSAALDAGGDGGEVVACPVVLLFDTGQEKDLEVYRQHIRIGMDGSIVPVGVNPSNQERLPCWKIQTRAKMTD
jgi:hypothetical protein